MHGHGGRVGRRGERRGASNKGGSSRHSQVTRILTRILIWIQIRILTRILSWCW